MRKRHSRESANTRSSSENESDKVTNRQINYVFNEKLKSKIYEITNEIKEANRKIALKEPHFLNNIKMNNEPQSENDASTKRSHDRINANDVSSKSNNELKFESYTVKDNSETNVENRKLKDDEQDVIESTLEGNCNTGYTSSITNIKEEHFRPCDRKEFSQGIKKTMNKVIYRRRSPAKKCTSLQRYKIRSKSLPQGVRRKFGFGSFVEVIDKQIPKFSESLMNIKSGTTIISPSKRTIANEGCGDKPRTHMKEISKSIFEKVKSSASNLTFTEVTSNYDQLRTEPSLSKIQGSSQRYESRYKNDRSCANLRIDLNAGQIKLSSAGMSVENEARSIKLDNVIQGKQKTLAIAPRQPIPFTICRTSKTFNLGLNIQQVLSMIKSKRHSAMLQAIIKDNIRTARSVIQKTEPNIKTLFIATSNRMTAVDSGMCPARDDADNCCSIISSNTEKSVNKCKLLTCRHSVKTEVMKDDNLPNMNHQYLTPMRQIEFHEVQRPEDVWVVEQPDNDRTVTRFRSRCTCFPTRNSVDYQKVLKQYTTMKPFDQKSVAIPENSLYSANFPARFVMSGPEFPLSSQSQISYSNNIIGCKVELKKVQEDFDNLLRRFEQVHEHVTVDNIDDSEVKAELDALEVELTCREEDCRFIMNFYDQLITLKKKIMNLRGKIKSSTNVSDGNVKPHKSRKDPFRPTSSMTLTRVLRQIQCLQDKLKLIDSPSIT